MPGATLFRELSSLQGLELGIAKQTQGRYEDFGQKL